MGKEKRNIKKEDTKNNGTKNKFVSNLWIIIVAIGVIIIVYPFVSQQYYNYLSRRNISDFKQTANKIESYEINKKIELANAYNQTLKPENIGDPFNEKERAGRAEYARMLEVHEKIGYVEIPKIEQNIIIKAGTSETVLQECAGHLEGTSLPTGGKNTHTVITAHRGLPSAKLFTNLDKVRVGDIFYITNIKEKLAYKVIQIKVVDPTDFEPVQVKKGKDYATLMTCTPYMINSHRLLVKGERIPLQTSKKIADKNRKESILRKMIRFILVLLLAFVSIIIYRKKLEKRKNIKKKNDKRI